MGIMNPLEAFMEIPIKDTKTLIKSLKTEIGDVVHDPDYDGEADILLCVINSLDSELGKIKSIKELPIEKQARVLADMSLLMQFLEGMQSDDDFLDEESLEWDDEE